MPTLRLLFFVLLVLNALALAAGLGWLGPSTPRGEPERLTNQINPQLVRLGTSAPADRQAPLAEPVAPHAPPQPAPPDPEPVPATPSPYLPDSPVAPDDRSEQAPVPAPPVPAAIVAYAEPPTPAPAPDSIPAQEPSTTCIAITDLTETLSGLIERLARDTGTPVETSLTQTGAASGWWVRIPPAASRQAADERAQQLRSLGVSDLFVVRETGPQQHAISLGLFRTEAAARQHLTDLQRLRVTGAEITARSPASYRLEISGPSEVVQALINRLPAGARDAGREPCVQ